MVVFKHEAILSFVDRLIHDQEFTEWFVARPAQALASHSLAARDLQDVVDVLATGRGDSHVARALQPTMQLLLVLSAEGNSGGGDTEERYARLICELKAARERLVLARDKAGRHWWKFW